MTNPPSLASLSSHVLRLIGRYPLQVFLAVAIPAALGAAVDSLAEQDMRFNFLVSLAVTFAQFVLISAILKGEGQHHAWGKPGRVASYIGQGIVTGLGIAVGLCLLLIPGLFLYARWIAVVPLIIGDGRTMGEAMRLSWQRTEAATIPIMGCVAICWAVFAAALLTMGFTYPEYGPAPLVAAIAANLLFFFALALGWLLAVAVHTETIAPASD